MVIKQLVLAVTAVLLLAAVQFAAVCSSSNNSSYWAFYCAGGNFTPGSPYGSGLDAVAAILPSRVASSPVLFNSSELAAGESTSYAVAPCQGDSSPSTCQSCITRGLTEARGACGFREGGFVFRDTCSVGYYNQSLTQWLPEDPSLYVTARRFERSGVTIQGSEFAAAIGELARAVAHRTVTSSTQQHFATRQKAVDTDEYRLTLYAPLYALAQCAPSLSAQDCDTCLTQVLETMFFISAGNTTARRAATLWCGYRYATHQFFAGRPTATFGDAKPSDKNKYTRKDVAIWVCGAIGTTLLLVILILATVLHCRKKSQKRWLSGDEKGKGVDLKNITDEDAARRADSPQVELCTSALDAFDNILDQANLKEIALFLDYDGTLSAIVNDPDEAHLTDVMRSVLQDVATLFKTSVVTGRSIEKVFNFLQIKGINYAGSHGMDIKLASTMDSGSTSEITADRASFQPAKEHAAMINEVFKSLLAETNNIVGANIEHNNFCVSLHYRNVAEEDLARVEQVVMETMNNLKDSVRLTHGHKVYEFRPPINWNKGAAVLYILRELGLDGSFPIYIGDDQTDEDAFKVLRQEKKGIGILVSKVGRETSALFSLKDPSEVMQFLKMLVSWKQQTEN